MEDKIIQAHHPKEFPKTPQKTEREILLETNDLHIEDYSRGFVIGLHSSNRSLKHLFKLSKSIKREFFAHKFKSKGNKSGGYVG